jgi:hypothetical protein
VTATSVLEEAAARTGEVVGVDSLGTGVEGADAGALVDASGRVVELADGVVASRIGCVD